MAEREQVGADHENAGHGTIGHLKPERPAQCAIVPQPTTTSPRRKHRGLPGRHTVRRLAEHDLLAAQRARHRRRAVAQLDRVDLVLRRGAGARRARRPWSWPSAACGPTVTVFARASVPSTYSGSPLPPMPSPRRWPTVKWWWPRWRPRRRPRAIDDVARALAQPAVAGQEARAPGAGQEAQVLRVGLGRHGQRRLARERADLGLAQVAEREAQPGQRARATARRACRSGPWPGRRPRAAGRRPCAARSGRCSASRRRGGRRRRASRRGARGRCSARTGSASGPRRGRPATARPRRRGTRRAGRA